ncbi:MAG TPA: Fic family protein [bacterium]|jgi:Fic family protein|nr:Fic family protein [bacterium]HQN72155.1 Fic family protein [bacterium]
MKKPANPPDVSKIITDGSVIQDDGTYKHWDKLRFSELPEGIPDHRTWWAMIKQKRRNNYKHLHIKSVDGTFLRFVMTDEFLETVHFFDQFSGGNCSTEKSIQNPRAKDYYLLSSIMEESITSSQLEGATTTRDIAKKMIRENRAPKNKSEQMILNNYEAINFVRSVKEEALSPELIKEIHSIISKNTLDNQEKSGVFRNESDDIHVMTYDNEVIFTPPEFSEIEHRINELCQFANEDDTKIFIHPVIKAVIIHFLLSYIHPFVDGNGRTARALFYWYMLKKGYWITEFISISRILRNAPVKYAMSFLYTETDEFDLTYFIDHQLKTIRRSIDELDSYIKRKMKEVESAEKMLRDTPYANLLNLRQLAFLKTALKSPGTIFTIREYMNTHNVVYQTARQDLLNMADKYKLIIKIKQGKSFAFISPSDLETRISR